MTNGDSTRDDDPDENDGWQPAGPRGAAALADMAARLTGAGLFTPPVPSSLVNDLMTGRPWAWATNTEWSPWAGYILQGGPGRATMPDCLAPSADDFWLFAHIGYGANSLGIGMVTRVGPLAIAQQHLYGGMYTDAEQTTAAVNRSIRVWAQTLKDLEELEQTSLWGPPRYLVTFSDYRGYAQICGSQTEPSAMSTDPGSAAHSLPDGWVVLADVRDDAIRSDLRWLNTLHDPILEIAARHLSGLLAESRTDEQ